MDLPPRLSADYITKNAEHVRIEEKLMQPLVEKLYNNLKNSKVGDSWTVIPLHPKGEDESTVNWIFLIDSLNFSFWTDTKKYMVTFNGNCYTGYLALCAIIMRALENGIDLLDARVLSNLKLEDARAIFRGDDPNVELPLLETRLEIMRQHGEILLREYNGSFVNCIKACEGSAQALLNLVCEKFPSFRDKAVYKGRNVTFYKRAQILIADLWLAFKGKSYGHFEDIDSLTAFADYRVPQVLAYFGVLVYDDELKKKLEDHEILVSGFVWEVEIRGACLQAIETLVAKTRELIKSRGDEEVTCNSILVDNFLWLFRREFASTIEAAVPMHRTRCIYY